MVVTSSNLVGQEGAERTNVDISQLAEDKAAAPVVPDIQPVSPHPSAVEGYYFCYAWVVWLKKKILGLEI